MMSIAKDDYVKKYPTSNGKEIVSSWRHSIKDKWDSKTKV